MMSRRLRVILFLAALAIAMLLLLPMRLVADNTGMAARAVSGSVWSGHFTDAQWRGAQLGDLDAGMAPLALLTGQGRLAITGPGLRGAILHGRRSGAARLTGTIGAAGVTPLPITRIDLTGVDIVFAGDECLEAAGSISIAVTLPGVGSQILAGTPRCDGGKLLVPLVAGAARMDMSFGGDGDYTANITVDGVDETARGALMATGFQITPTGVVLNMKGRL